ncbi:MAG: hypothetical protein JWN98_1674 [Abditibacteriota bacterium]|nr:hypothetical protein [Abditibacteriota bacterium]
MKNWMNRFALLAAIVGVMGSALVMGCGGGGEDDAAAGGNNTTTGNAAGAPATED